MHMDETSWNGTPNQVVDSSGGNNNGTSFNGANTVAGGISGRAGSFNNSYVTINYASGMPPMDNFTMEAWIKPTTTHEIDVESNSGVGGVYGQKYVFKPDQRGPLNGGAGISAGTNGITVYEHGDNYLAPLAVYSGSISSSQWTHVSVVYTNKRPSIYVNGTLVRTGLQSTRQHVYAPQVIGIGDYGNFIGLVDEVAIYDKPLSAAEVLLHSQLNYSVYCGSADAIINWTTNINSTSYVDYGLTTSYGSTAGSDLLNTNHSITLTNLSSQTTYHYRVRFKSFAGDEIVSGDNTFAMGPCIVPGSPSAPTLISSTAGNAQATISWTAGTGSTSSLIKYGTTSGVYTTTLDPATSPQTITSLVNGTPIYYQVGAKNMTGTTWSSEYSVTPLTPPSVPNPIIILPGNGLVTITWTAGTGSTSSLIRYGTTSGSLRHHYRSCYIAENDHRSDQRDDIYYQVGAKNAAAPRGVPSTA